MPVINENAFVKAMVEGRVVPANMPYGMPAQRNIYDPHAPVDAASAKQLFHQLENYVKDGGYMHKQCRPWNFSDEVFTKLDRKQPWWGFEFETGWAGQNARREAVSHTWDNYEGCMFDGEGEGNWAVEITFCPAEASSYMNGTAPAYKFMEWVSNHPHLCFHGDGNDVGTHLNMSDPRFKTKGQVRNLVRFLNRTLQFTRAVNGQRKTMFGRETIYAGFFYNSSNNGANEWMEFKGFRTTYELDTFRRYLQTAAGLQRVIDTFYDLGADAAEGKAVSNLYDVAFNGADPEVKPYGELKIAPRAAAMHSRQWGGFGEL